MPEARRRRWPRNLGVIAAVLTALYVVFFLVPASASGDWAIDMAEVRKLASSIEGDKPTEIHLERVADFKFPLAIMKAGGSWSMQPMTMFAYQLVFPTHMALVDVAENESVPGGEFHAEPF